VARAPAATYETQTDSDGRASAHLTLGGVTGLDKQTITATFIDAPAGRTITKKIVTQFDKFHRHS